MKGVKTMKKQNQTKPQRPFSLNFAEAKRDIVSAVNEASRQYGVPSYLLEEILLGVLHQVQNIAIVERENARIAYEKELAEYEEMMEGQNGGA